MGDVGADVHQVGDALAALSLGIALEQLADLEEQHDEHRLRELRLGTRQEADGEGADGGYRHEEMLVEGIAVDDALDSLLQRVVADNQVGYKIDEQQLPRRQCQIVLNDDGADQQHGCGCNQGYAALHAAVLVVMMVVLVSVVVRTALMVVVVRMFHIFTSFFE